MPRVRAWKHPRWTGRVWRCNHTPDGVIVNGPVAIFYVFIEGVTPWSPLWRRQHWACVVGHEIGNPRRVWRFEFDTRLGLPWVRDVTEVDR